jgi:uncharacterized protein YuzE
VKHGNHREADASDEPSVDTEGHGNLIGMSCWTSSRKNSMHISYHSQSKVSSFTLVVQQSEGLASNAR